MEDSTPNLEADLAIEAASDMLVRTGVRVRLRLTGKHDALLPISVVGGLIGMLAGTLPAAIWVLLLGVSFSPLYVFMPLFIYWGIKVFKGYSGRRGYVITCIFSVIGFYLTILSCHAALYVIRYEMLFLNLPLVTISLIGRSEIFDGPVFSSIYVFPALFTILGVLLAHELLMRKQKPVILPEPDLNAETE